ncbi:MAG: hypothetical protein AAGI30_02325 [Planctomycetota bacterium]
MNVASFLQHWGLREHPFSAEEARDDAVFPKLDAHRVAHPDFEKFAGDPARPASAVLFGEKGAGKTAIRLHLAGRIAAHHAASPGDRVLLVSMDELNPVLDRFADRFELSPRPSERAVLEVLREFTIADHLDAVLHRATIELVDQLAAGDGSLRASLRSASPSARRTIAQLAALYDRPDDDGARRALVRGATRTSGAAGATARVLFGALGWLPAAGVLTAIALAPELREGFLGSFLPAVFAALLAVWLLGLVKVVLWDGMVLRRLVARVHAAIRSGPRGRDALRAAIGALPGPTRAGIGDLKPGAEGARYALLEALVRSLREIGFRGVLLVYDRLDEPTLINGEVERMRTLVWPLLTNTLFQQGGVAIKLLLPIELRHELFRESAEFFQTARLDKQNLVERLSWTGAMLYDLCNARLAACADGAVEPVLADLFDENVGQQHLIDALESMRQPRDAFKLLHQCIGEHCATTSVQDDQWHVARHVLDTVRREQVERLEQFARGIRPG